MITYPEHPDLRDTGNATPAGVAEAREGDMHESEITYRMTRLREEADRARRAAEGRPASAPARRSGLRRFVGHALIDLGQLLEGAAPCPDERTGPARA